MYYRPGWVFYVIAVIVILVIFAGIGARVRLWLLGRAGIRGEVKKSRIPWALITTIFFQPRLLRLSKARWLIHMAIFYGFGGLFLHTALLFIIDDFIPEKTAVVQFFYNGPGQKILDFWGDLWGAVFLAGVLAAIIRRFVIRDSQLVTLAEDTVSIVLLLLVALTGFWVEAARLAEHWPPPNPYSFVGIPFARLLLPAAGEFSTKLALYVHIVISFGFLVYFPFSKMMHVIAAPAEAVFEEAGGEEVRR
jgi:nitrate reductase gamma subunit